MVTTLNGQQRTIILIPSYRYGDENSDKQESKKDAILSKEEKKKNYRVLLKSKLTKCFITFISPSGWVLWFGHRTVNQVESSRETG